MKKTKQAFTMVELIFVIVILGIVSGIAIPKLMGTRDDARISKLAKAIQTVHSEIIAAIVSSNKVPQNKEELEKISNTILESSPDYAITVVNGKVIQFIDTDNGSEICKVLTINDTNVSRVTLDYSNGNGVGAICVGVRSLVPNISSDFILSGNVVVY